MADPNVLQFVEQFIIDHFPVESYKQIQKYGRPMYSELSPEQQLQLIKELVDINGFQIQPLVK